jgi:hypothetical protein
MPMAEGVTRVCARATQACVRATNQTRIFCIRNETLAAVVGIINALPTHTAPAGRCAERGNAVHSAMHNDAGERNSCARAYARATHACVRATNQNVFLF